MKVTDCSSGAVWYWNDRLHVGVRVNQKILQSSFSICWWRQKIFLFKKNKHFAFILKSSLDEATRGHTGTHTLFFSVSTLWAVIRCQSTLSSCQSASVSVSLWLVEKDHLRPVLRSSVCGSVVLKAGSLLTGIHRHRNWCCPADLLQSRLWSSSVIISLTRAQTAVWMTCLFSLVASCPSCVLLLNSELNYTFGFAVFTVVHLLMKQARRVQLRTSFRSSHHVFLIFMVQASKGSLFIFTHKR